MNNTMSATEARVHFGEVLRRVRANDTITVERGGKPEAVILSVAAYERLRANQGDTEEPEDWWEAARRSRERIAKELNGRTLPPIEDVIHEMREERDAQILDNLRRR